MKKYTIHIGKQDSKHHIMDRISDVRNTARKSANKALIDALTRDEHGKAKEIERSVLRAFFC